MLVLVLAAALVTTAPGADSVPHLRLRARIDPAAHHLTVQARVEHWPCGPGHRLYLDRRFPVARITAGGRPVTFSVDTAAAPAQWTDNTRPLVFECPAGPIDLTYDGVLADTVGGVNLIAANLVELAMYAGWFPYDPTGPAFTYDLELNLPAGWVAATSARLVRSTVARGREQLRFESRSPAKDVAFAASPEFLVRQARQAGAAAEVYALGRDSALSAAAITQIGQALARYRAWYGPTEVGSGPTPPTRFVYSPRGGWGYSRLPMVVLPAEYARQLAARPLGSVPIFQGMAHEIAHFWWQIADTNKPDDWINEGLAEFSAFSAVGDLFGEAMRDSLRVRYQRDAAAVTATTPIAATRPEVNYGYVNRYEKPALLFEAVERRVGPERLHTFLASFYAAHRARRDATTTAFLAAARAALGDDVGARIERCVMGTWTADCAQ